MRKFTLFFSLLVAIATTAMADFTQKYVKTNSGAFWCGAIASYPTGVTNVKPSNASSVFAPTFLVKVSNAGTVTVSFEHKTGDHALNILGVDILNASGGVVKSHYECKKAGGNETEGTTGQKIYTLSDVPAGTYSLRYFVCNITDSDNVANAGGDVVVTNAEMPLNTSRYHYINNARGYVGLYSDGATTMKGVAVGNALSWKFAVREDGLYDIINASGQYISSVTTTVSSQPALTLTTEQPANGWRFALSNTADKYVIYSGTTQMHMLNPNNANSANGSLVNWGYNSNNPTVGARLDDGGCNFSIEELISDEDIAEAKTFFDEYAGKVGYPTDAVIDTYKAAVEAAGSFTDIETAKAAVYASTDMNMPAAGKFYALDSYMSFLSDPADAAANLKTNVTSKYTKSALWLFEEQGNGVYHIKNALTGKYIGNSAKMSDTAKEFVLVTTNTEETAGAIETKTVEFGKLYIKESAATSRLCLHSTAENAKMHQGGGLGNQYSFIEVPALSVGNAGWATLCLGVNTTIPADVDVYAVTGVKEGNWLNMTEVTGVLPANEGVLVNAAAGLYVFEETATEASIDGNLLEGSLYDNLTQEDAYILAMVGNEVGLYAAAKDKDADGTAVAEGETGTHFTCYANRAYLPASAVPASLQQSVGFRFDFGGTTAVEKVEIRNEKEEIYDLQGRRINEITQPGIYVVNGVKVLVK